MRAHYKTILAAFCAVALSACGGDLSGGSDGGGGDDGVVVEPDAVIITTRLLDCPSDWNKDISRCTDTQEISVIKSGILAVTLSQSDAPLASEIINATLTAGALNSDAALTNAQGIAFFTVLASNAEGASRVTVTSDAAEQESTDSLNFTIGSSSVSIAITNDTNNISLAQNATALVTVTLTSEELLYTTPVTVSFSSACTTEGTANLDTSVLTVDGVAQATYQPIGCVGDDVITASAEVNNLSINTTINVASSPADSIRFISASPQNIAVKGTGGEGRQETSTVIFKVVDQNGLPSSLQEVVFSLDRAPTGATINPITAKTNSEGEVSTVISAGAGSGTVKVKVKLSDPALIISSVSSSLVVSTGLPDQKSFSISLENFSPEVLEYDGDKIGVSVQLADHHNNAVPDGTSVFFHAEAGAINEQSTGTVGSCTTTGNSCSVNWVSGGDEPPGNKLNNQGLLYGCAQSNFYAFAPCITANGMGQPYGGRVTITAFAEGEEDFTDNNHDGLFTKGEDFKDDNCDGTYTYNEPFVDTNNDGVWNTGESFTDIDGNRSYTVRDSFVDANGDNKYTGDTFVDRAEVFYDYNEDGQFKANQKCDIRKDLQDDPSIAGAQEEDIQDVNSDGQFTFGNKLFNGLSCSESEENLGNCVRDFVHVSDNITLIMASKDQYIRVINNQTEVNHVDLTTATGTASVGLTIYVADIYNNRPPAETVIAIATTNGVLSSKASFIVPSSNAYGPYYLPIVLTREAEPNKLSSGLLSISITTPKGTNKTYNISVSDDG